MSFKSSSYSPVSSDGCKGGNNTVCMIFKSSENITIETSKDLTLKGKKVFIQASERIDGSAPVVTGL